VRSSEITRPRYQWQPLELSPENDFIGFDGEILIGRIFLEPRPRFKGLWHWSNIRSETALASQGYAASADLAAVTVEALYDELRAFEGNVLAKSQ
jgi:hypothetical protein